MTEPRNGTARPLDATRSDPTPSSEDDHRIASALEEYLGELRSGRRPDRANFLARHPEVADKLDGCLDALEFVHSAAFAGSAEDPDSSAEWSLPAATRLGDFQILREVGRGAMGVVYEAEQVSLARRVALKILPFGSAIDPRRVRRFQIEAQAAAHLHHPHIVPIFVVGADRGTNYYAMRFIQGRTLADLIRGMRDASLAGGGPSAADLDSTVDAAATPAPISVAPRDLRSNVGRAYFRAIARLGLQAAEALDHAHGLGVIHRDIKPANLMVDDHGELWVTDFGLAKFEQATGPTRSGDLLGTFRYMSPEQARAGCGIVDQRTDVYSLGATLYELATLRPAFDGLDRQELLRKLTLDEPSAPRRLEPALPRDLETIILKAMAKEPSGRYATARELADDLVRFLDDRAIHARRPTPLERLTRRARRHRTAVASAAATLILASTAAAGLLWAENRRTAEAYGQLRVVREADRAALPRIFATANALAMRAMEKVSLIDRVAKGKEDPEFYRLVLAYYEAIARIARDDRDPLMREVAAKAHFGVGAARALLGMPGAEEAYAKSVEVYEGLIRDYPQNQGLPIHLAASLQYLGGQILSGREQARAEPTYRRLLEVARDLVAHHPESREYWDYLSTELSRWARVMANAGRRAEAEGMLTEAIGFAPGRAEAKATLAYLLASRPDLTPHDPARALRLAEDAVKLAPDSAESWKALGIAHARSGEWPSAAVELERADALDKDGDPALISLLALTQARLGDLNRARRLLDRADARIKMSPPADPDLPYMRSEAAAELPNPIPIPSPKPPGTSLAPRRPDACSAVGPARPASASGPRPSRRWPRSPTRPTPRKSGMRSSPSSASTPPPAGASAREPAAGLARRRAGRPARQGAGPPVDRHQGLHRRRIAHPADDQHPDGPIGLPPLEGGQVPPPRRDEQTDAIFAQLKKVNPEADPAGDTLRISIDAKTTVDLGPSSRHGAEAGAG